METKKKALIVDDDYDYLVQQKTLLENEGFDVVLAEGEKQAREAMNENKFDLALVDLMMEDMDSGFIVSYELKKNNPDMRIIMITSVTSQTGYSFDSLTEYEKNWVKADTILSKPVRKEQLLKEINKVHA